MQLIHVLIVCAIVVLLVAGAWSDLATRMIPHWIALGILPLALCLRARQGGDMLLDSVLVAFGLFAGLTILHAKGLIGGGDVKLAAVIALALSPVQTLQFIETTALIGGILAVVYLLAGRIPLRLSLDPSRRLLRRVMAIEMRRARKRGPLPYGVALAAGAALILFRS